MRTFSALAMVLLVSSSALGGTGHRLNSNLTYRQLAETCDPQAAGAAQLYCAYYMMGLIDGLVIAAEAEPCLPDAASVVSVRRAVYDGVKNGSASRKPAIGGVAAALKAAFPCR